MLPPIVDLETLGLDRGAHLLIKRALEKVAPGEPVGVRGTAPHLEIHLRGWCRAQGHELAGPAPGEDVLAWIVRGGAHTGRWRGASETGAVNPMAPGAVAERPAPSWGLAARGAVVEAGAPALQFRLDEKTLIWADEAPRLYAQAAAAQWDPASAVDWEAPFELPDEVEEAVVQVMTYLIENENAALVVPARFLGQVHPHFREVAAVLAVQVADEARHIEVFTRRAALKRPGGTLGLSTASGQASLATLLDEPDFALASFLLSVMGEGTFVTLLTFLELHAPDPVTRRIAHLAAADEARHVAFGMHHLAYQLERDPTLLERLKLATERRHDALAGTAGLNEEVFDALVLLAAGSFEPEAIARGFERVQTLKADMSAGRRGRLLRLGFTPEEADRLSGLHTRNFM